MSTPFALTSQAAVTMLPWEGMGLSTPTLPDTEDSLESLPLLPWQLRGQGSGHSGHRQCAGEECELTERKRAEEVTASRIELPMEREGAGTPTTTTSCWC